MCSPSAMRPSIRVISGFHSRYPPPSIRTAHTASGDAPMIEVLVYSFMLSCCRPRVTPVLDAHARYFHVHVEAPSSLRMRAACSTCGSKFVAFTATVPLPHFFRYL